MRPQKQALQVSEASDLLRVFFAEAVPQSAKKFSIPLSPEIEIYLTNLLHASHRSEFLFQHPAHKPLAILFLEAETLPPAEGRYLLKWLGDFILFTVGYFSESLSRQLVGSHYYCRLGAAAYSHLASLGKGLSPYRELSENFTSYTDIIYDIALSSRQADLDLLHLYSEWQERHSRVAEERLLAAGVIPIPTSRLPV